MGKTRDRAALRSTQPSDYEEGSASVTVAKKIPPENGRAMLASHQKSSAFKSERSAACTGLQPDRCLWHGLSSPRFVVEDRRRPTARRFVLGATQLTSRWPCRDAKLRQKKASASSSKSIRRALARSRDAPQPESESWRKEKRLSSVCCCYTCTTQQRTHALYFLPRNM